MEKANLTPIRVALLCVTTLFLCNTAIAQQTFTVSEKVNVKGTECTRTFNCYYGDNDERIMHGLCKTEGKEKTSDGPNHKYTFSHTENVNYSHGKKDGKYYCLQKIYSSSVDVYHDYQINRDKRMRRGNVINREVSGGYKDDQRDGVWKETITRRDTLGGEPTKYNNVEKNTFVFSDGKLIELTQSDGSHYEFRYAIRDGREITLLSGKSDKYTIKDGIIVSHIVRLNGDETEMDNELKQFISDKENLFDYEEELLSKGYVISEAKNINYKYQPCRPIDYSKQIEDDDYSSCTIYILKKGQINFASKDEIIQYLSETINEKDFEETYSMIMENKYYHIPYGNYIKVSDLKEVQPTIDRYREMFSQIRTIREEVFALKKKIEENSPQDGEHIRSLIRIDGGIGYIYLDNFYAKDSSKIERWLENMHDCLAVEKKYYSYAIKKDKQNIIAAKADTIRSIYGENSQVYQKFSEIYNKNSQYDFCKKYSNSNHLSVWDLNDFCRSVDNGLVIADNGIDYLRVLLQLNEIKEEITGDPYFEHVKTQYEASVSILGDGWDGNENGDKIRQLIPTMEKYKIHVEALGTIDKNNEKIVMLSEKTKKIKKIYTEYYNNIQRDYNDNSIEYLNAIINNQNTLIAALEAEEPKNVDKKVKKGDAETMEDIIQIIKHQ